MNKRMTLNSALKILVEVGLEKVQKLSFNANIYDVFHDPLPVAVNASKHKKRIMDAINLLADYFGYELEVV